ncbi:hypothetical protein [Aureimonas populi]|uniref:Uncharacterized protein n=1 Tax=Aureimonas populi TaxID=1701758 RepID=A0ABW5CMI7_9HYPH|nr:hypothetical protein [Aureimonas populi]
MAEAGRIMMHALIALLFQSAIRLGTGRWSHGAFAMSAFFWAREITQAEYRWIAASASRLRADMPWWAGLDLTLWDGKSLADALLPTLATIVLWWLAQPKN